MLAFCYWLSSIYLHAICFVIIFLLLTFNLFLTLFVAGNLLHLIVEACIARNILDTSAYLWPGYVKGRTNQIPRVLSGQMHGWSSFVKGSSLTPPLVNALVSTPASRYASNDKVVVLHFFFN